MATPAVEVHVVEDELVLTLRLTGAGGTVVATIDAAKLPRKAAGALLSAMAEVVDPYVPDAMDTTPAHHHVVLTLEPGRDDPWRYSCSCGEVVGGWTTERGAEIAGERHLAEAQREAGPFTDALQELVDRPDVDLAGGCTTCRDGATLTRRGDSCAACHRVAVGDGNGGLVPIMDADAGAATAAAQHQALQQP